MCFAFFWFLISSFALTSCFLFCFVLLFCFFFFLPGVNVKQMQHYWLKNPIFSYAPAEQLCCHRDCEQYKLSLMSYAASNQSDKSCFCVCYQRARLQHFINMQPNGACCSGITAVPARSSMRDWMGFSWLLNNVTQIEMVGPGGLWLPHSHLQWSHVMKSGDEAIP